VQAGMGTSGYTVGPLSDGEVCLRSFGRRMRRLIPECRLHRAPPRGWSEQRARHARGQTEHANVLGASEVA
jgi:carnitine monooxygenase subunit